MSFRWPGVLIRSLLGVQSSVYKRNKPMPGSNLSAHGWDTQTGLRVYRVLGFRALVRDYNSTPPKGTPPDLEPY